MLYERPLTQSCEVCKCILRRRRLQLSMQCGEFSLVRMSTCGFGILSHVPDIMCLLMRQAYRVRCMFETWF